MKDNKNDDKIKEKVVITVSEQTKKKGKIRTMKEEFVGFLWEYSVVGLAIGVIIGGAVNAFVQSLVSGVLTPLIQLVLPFDTLKGLVYTYNNVNFAFGPLISAFLNLVIIAMVIFFTVKYLLFKGGKIERNKLSRD